MQIPNYSLVIIFLKQKINTLNDACKCTIFFIHTNKMKKKITLYATAKKKTAHFHESCRYLC